jgi:predicted nucleotidyltransferase
MRPSEALRQHRQAICEAIARSTTRNPRVFGSVLRGEDADGSDLDLLVDALPGTTLLDMAGLQQELEQIVGLSVDLLTPGDLPRWIRERVLSEARPL